MTNKSVLKIAKLMILKNMKENVEALMNTHLYRGRGEAISALDTVLNIINNMSDGVLNEDTKKD